MENVSVRHDESELRELLGSFFAEAMRYDTDETLRLLKREDLSMQRVGAMHVVARSGAACISDISACLDLSLANTSMLVDKLVCSGFVTRIEDANDRRHKLVRLTEKGQAIIKEVQATRINHVVQRMQQLSPELVTRAIIVLREITVQFPQK